MRQVIYPDPSTVPEDDDVNFIQIHATNEIESLALDVPEEGIWSWQGSWVARESWLEKR